MTIRKDRAALLAVVLGFMLAGGELSSPCDASFVPIVNVDPSTQGQNVYHWGGMVGWTFSVQQAVIVKQVGFYDEGRRWPLPAFSDRVVAGFDRPLLRFL